MRIHRYKQHRILNLYYYGVDHTPHCRSRVAARTHRVMAMFSLCLNIESTTRLWQRTDLASRFAWDLVACSVGLPKCAALCAVRLKLHLYGHPRLCTQHYNSDQWWAFWTCSRAHLICPPGKDTDYIRKLSLWKIIFFFVYYSIIIPIVHCPCWPVWYLPN